MKDISKILLDEIYTIEFAENAFDGPFVWIPEPVLLAKDVSMTTIRVYIHMNDNYDKVKQRGLIDYKYLMKICGCSRRAVSYSLTCLEKHNFIKVHKKGHKKFVEYILAPEPDAETLKEMEE